MPPELVNKIHADVSKVLDLPQTQGVLREEQLRAGHRLAREFAKLVETRFPALEALIDQVGAKVD
jgi:hypothetical protein